jgi:mannose-6-phosphate isomerase-like protein (cupin superfamily)
MANDSLWFLDTLVTVRVAWAENTDHISVLEHRAPAGDFPPLHVHQTEDEVFCVLEGTLRLHVAGQDRTVGPGQTLLAPKGLPHTYRVESPEGARWLAVTTQRDFENFVRKHGTTSSPPRAPTSLRPPDAGRRDGARRDGASVRHRDHGPAPGVSRAPAPWRPRLHSEAAPPSSARGLPLAPSLRLRTPQGPHGTGSTSPSPVASATELISATFLAYSSGV